MNRVIGVLMSLFIGSIAIGAEPVDIRAMLASKVPGAKAEDVQPTPISGVYEISLGGSTGYITADGKYLIAGDLYDVASKENLTEGRRATVRIKELAAIKDVDTIVFAPAGPVKHSITVFTDVDCGYCRKLHSEIAELNKLGIKVRYAAYPRSGPGTESWIKMESVWCAKNRRDALTRAKLGEDPQQVKCGATAVAKQYDLGSKLGINGTPALMTVDGDYIGGYMPPDKLLAHLEQLKIVAAAKSSAVKGDTKKSANSGS